MGFKPESLMMDVVASGKGGMHAVVRVLKAQFNDAPAVALFRVTAVDDRGNTVSYRTKVVHVIYIGPNMAVMKRAKIGAYNKAFKDPFSVNLAIQTNDADGDLTEAAIEKTLRASGGAHQPSHFDFANNSVPTAGGGSGGGGESTKASSLKAFSSSSGASPSSPSVARNDAALPEPLGLDAEPAANEAEPAPTAAMVIDAYLAAWAKNDDDLVASFYTDASKVVQTDTARGVTSVHVGVQAIKAFVGALMAMARQADLVPTTLTWETAGDATYLHRTSQGHWSCDTFVVLDGKVAVHTSVLGYQTHAAVAEKSVSWPENPVEAEVATSEPADDLESPSETPQVEASPSEASPSEEWEE